jgi:hypothetical protein
LDLKTFGAVANVAAVINVPKIKRKWAATVMPKTTKEPKYSEKMIHHIQESNCMIKCLIDTLGIALRGFHSASITPLYNCKKRFFIMVYTCDRSDQITNFFKI